MCILIESPTVFQVLEELKRLVSYYRGEVGDSVQLLGLALSARKNLCIHPEVGQRSNWKVHHGKPYMSVKTLCMLYVRQVSKEDEGKFVDSKCHKLTASFVRRSHQRDKNVPVCLYFEVS